MYVHTSAGRGWKAAELRQKSWEDLHQLWYVCLKEKNMLLSQKQMLTSQNMRMPNPERFPKVSFFVSKFYYLGSDVLKCLDSTRDHSRNFSGPHCEQFF